MCTEYVCTCMLYVVEQCRLGCRECVYVCVCMRGGVYECVFFACVCVRVCVCVCVRLYVYTS